MGLSSYRGRFPRVGKSLRRSGLVQDLIVDVPSLSPLDKGSVSLSELSCNSMNKKLPVVNTSFPTPIIRSTPFPPAPLLSRPPSPTLSCTNPPHTIDSTTTTHTTHPTTVPSDDELQLAKNVPDTP